jgi:hypothetical protein
VERVEQEGAAVERRAARVEVSPASGETLVVSRSEEPSGIPGEGPVSDGLVDPHPVSTEPPETPTAFDKEFDRLQSVLTYHRPAHPREPVVGAPPPLDEERIENWVARVVGSLSRLRKHRAKRLSEQINDGS